LRGIWEIVQESV